MVYNSDIEKWIVPSVFSGSNIPAVLRSAALAREPYGQNFIYRDGIQAPNLPAALFFNFFGTLLTLTFKFSLLQSPSH